MQSRTTTLPITRRFLALSTLGLLGAILFVPSVLASANPRPSFAQLSLFVMTVAFVCAGSTWIGLRCADAVALPMPYLRRFDDLAEAPRAGGFLGAIGFGVLFALATIVMLRTLHLPNLAGPLWSRMASVVFAAGSLELVIHLFVMSSVVRVARGKTWIGIVVATIFFVLFHASGLSGQSISVAALSVLMNSIFALGLGIMFARYGFEFVLICHAVGHVLAVSFA